MPVTDGMPSGCIRAPRDGAPSERTGSAAERQKGARHESARVPFLAKPLGAGERSAQLRTRHGMRSAHLERPGVAVARSREKVQMRGAQVRWSE